MKANYAGQWYDEDNAGQYMAWFTSCVHGQIEATEDTLELEARNESVSKNERKLLK